MIQQNTDDGQFCVGLFQKHTMSHHIIEICNLPKNLQTVQ